MCTFNFSLNDTIVNQIRPAFEDEAAVQRWMQEQLEKSMIQFAATMNKPKESAKKHSLSHLRGIFATGMTDNQLKEEYMAEKYDL